MTTKPMPKMVVDNVALCLLLALGDTGSGGTHDDAREALEALDVSKSAIDQLMASAVGMKRRRTALGAKPSNN